MRHPIIIIFFLIFGLSNILYAQVPSNISNAVVDENYRGNIQFFLVKAENLFRQGNQLDALIELDNAVDLAPQNPEVYIQRSLLRYRLGMATAAREDAAMAARLSPITPALFGIKGPQAQMDLLAFYPEEIFQKISWENQLAQYESTLDNWYEELYAVEVSDAFPELESAITHFEGALTALENKSWYKAIEELTYLELFKANTSVINDLKGLVYLEIGDLDYSTNAFRKAISLDPNNAMAWYNFSKISKRFENYETTLDFLNKAIGLNPTFSNAYFERALVKKKLGDIEGAIADYTIIINRTEDNFLSAQFNRAICYKKIGQLTNALNDLKEVLLHETDDSMAWKVRGNIHLLAGRYNLAIADFTKAIDLNGELGTAYFNRGVAHLLNQNPMTACIDFERSAIEGYERALEKQRYFCTN